jgi:hypothetical protein
MEIPYQFNAKPRVCPMQSTPPNSRHTQLTPKAKSLPLTSSRWKTVGVGRWRNTIALLGRAVVTRESASVARKYPCKRFIFLIANAMSVVMTSVSRRQPLEMNWLGTIEGSFALNFGEGAGPRSRRPFFDLAVDEGSIDLDNTAEFFDILNQGTLDLVAHFPSGFVGTKTHEPHNVQWARGFFAGQHQMDDPVPVPQRLFGVLKNRADKMRKAITGLSRAFVTLPTPGAVLEFVRVFSATTRATNAIGPTPRHKISGASIFVRKHRLKLGGGELINRLWSLASHGSLSSKLVHEQAASPSY